jgi:hypothetical protein
MKNVFKILILIQISLFFMETTHGQQAGGIVFSSSPINPDKPNESITEFKSGDKIYALAYLPDVLKNLYQNQSPNAELLVEVFIYEVIKPLYDYQNPMDNQLTFAEMHVKGKIKDQKYLIVDLLPDAANTTAYGNNELVYKSFGNKYEGPATFAETMSNLTPGEHKIKMVIHCYYAPVAQGEFLFNGSDFSNYKSLADQLNLYAANKASASAVFPKAVVSDPTRESSMISSLKNSNDWKSGFVGAVDVLKVAIVYDWETIYHDISGAILYRYCKANIAMKSSDGHCFYRPATFKEEYVNGKFQALHYDGIGDKVSIECANL